MTPDLYRLYAYFYYFYYYYNYLDLRKANMADAQAARVAATLAKPSAQEQLRKMLMKKMPIRISTNHSSVWHANVTVYAHTTPAPGTVTPDPATEGLAVDTAKLASEDAMKKIMNGTAAEGSGKPNSTNASNATNNTLPGLSPLPELVGTQATEGSSILPETKESLGGQLMDRLMMRNGLAAPMLPEGAGDSTMVMSETSNEIVEAPTVGESPASTASAQASTQASAQAPPGLIPGAFTQLGKLGGAAMASMQVAGRAAATAAWQKKIKQS